jgi:hypothetical protein
MVNGARLALLAYGHAEKHGRHGVEHKAGPLGSDWLTQPARPAAGTKKDDQREEAQRSAKPSEETRHQLSP